MFIELCVFTIVIALCSILRVLNDISNKLTKQD
jgi:hypothetical protein